MDSRTPPEQSLPSTTAIAVATAILAGLSGYFIGQASSIGLFSSTTSSHQKAKAAAPRKSWPNSYDVQVHPDSSDEELMTHLRGSKRNDRRTPKEIADSEEDEEESEHGKEDAEDVNEDLKSFEDNREECKLVLCVRTDLGMSKGKIAAQASHATLANFTALLSHSPPPSQPHPILRRWQRQGQAKIALQVPGGESQLEELQAIASSLGLCACMIRDAGRTQIPGGTATVLGVGPGPKSIIDQVTGSLKLL